MVQEQVPGVFLLPALAAYQHYDNSAETAGSTFNMNASRGAQHMYVGSGGETTMDPALSLWTILPIIRCV